MELCERAEARGWSAGFLAADAFPTTAAIAVDRGPWLGPTLVVIEDAASLMSALLAWFPQLARLGALARWQLRLLLLERDGDAFGGCWAGLVATGVAQDLGQPVRLSGLSKAGDRLRLVSSAMNAAAQLVASRSRRSRPAPRSIATNRCA